MVSRPASRPFGLASAPLHFAKTSRLPKSHMQNWQTIIPSGLSRLYQSRMSHSTTVGEVRRRYELLAASFGAPPADLIVERAQLGQVKGEWVRVSDAQTHRLLLYLHGGGFISGSPETHRALIAKLCRAGGAAALSVDYRLAPEFPFPAGLRDAVDAYRFLIAKGVPPASIMLARNGPRGRLPFPPLIPTLTPRIPIPPSPLPPSPPA